VNLRDGCGEFDWGDDGRGAFVVVSGRRSCGGWRRWFVRIPGWCPGGLTAKRICHAFSVANFLWGACNGDEGLKNGVDEEPAYFAGTRGGYLLFFSQCPIAFEAEILAYETALHYLDVIAICSSNKGGVFGHAVFHFGLFVTEELGEGLGLVLGWKCGGCWKPGKRMR